MADDTRGLIRRTLGQTLVQTKDKAYLRRFQGQYMAVALDPLNLRAVQVEYLEEDRKPVTLRRTVGQVLVQALDPITLRGVQVEYLEIEILPPKLDKPAWPSLLAKINEYNGTKFTQQDVTFENPTAVNLPGKYNTRLTLRAQPSSQHSGTVDVYYPRFPISNYLKGDPKPLDLTGKDSVHDLLPQINALWGLVLDTYDVVDSAIEPSGEFYVTIANSSLYFVPGSRYRYGSSVPLSSEFAVQDIGSWGLPTFEERFTEQDLGGFGLPTFAERYPRQYLPHF